MRIADIRHIIRFTSGFQQTKAIIDLIGNEPVFLRLAQAELRDLRIRDTEDEAKLNQGILYAASRGLIPETVQSREWISISTDCRTPSDIRKDILGRLGDARQATIALCGRSGIGKGTIAEELRIHLSGCRT